MYWPTQKAIPRASVSSSHPTAGLAFDDSILGATVSLRLAISSVPLLTSKIRVLRYSTEGRAKCVQSVVPSRTNSALVKAAKDMEMANMPTQMPLREARSALPAIAPAAATDFVAGSEAACGVTGFTIVEDIVSCSLRNHLRAADS